MNLTTKIAGAIAGATAAAILAAGPANADAETVDEIAFISTLDSQGIYYSSEDAALTVGYAVCNALDAGASPTSIASTAVRSTGGFYTYYQAGYITGAAIGAFCPEYAPLVTGQHA